MFYKQEKRKVQLKFPKGEGRTKQSFRSQCNINDIMKKYEKTGLIEHIKQGGTYGDFTQPLDYHGALNEITKATASFMTLPANLRKRFDNDPAKLISFLADEKNRTEAEELGLVARPKEVPVDPKTTKIPKDPKKADPVDPKLPKT